MTERRIDMIRRSAYGISTIADKLLAMTPEEFARVDSAGLINAIQGLSSFIESEMDKEATAMPHEVRLRMVV